MYVCVLQMNVSCVLTGRLSCGPWPGGLFYVMRRRWRFSPKCSQAPSRGRYGRQCEASTGQSVGHSLSRVNGAGKNHSPRQTHLALLLFLLRYCSDNNNVSSSEIWPWRHWDGLKLRARFCAFDLHGADLPGLAWNLNRRNVNFKGKSW